MKNVTASSVSKKDFYKREKLIRKIYRRLDAGDHVFLAAPRRVGKTSIMWYLRDEPAENYHFIYVTVEAANDIETRFYF